MQRLRISSPAVLLVVLASSLPLWPVCTQASPVTGLFEQVDTSWIKNPYWFQGDAEVNYYAASVVKYGEPRSSDDIVHILVTEKHKPELLVKADDWHEPDLVEMLKFNYVIDVQTGVYSYQQMMSVFFDQRDLRVAKMTFASHEWCGNTFKEIVNFDGESSYEYNTYWDGEGSGRYDVAFPEDLTLYDALPAQLRMLKWQAGLQLRFPLLPTQISSHATAPQVHQATLRVSTPEEVSVPAGEFRAYPVRVEHISGLDRLWFEVDFPHRMLQWETHDGHRFALRRSEKLAYWKLNRPGDEAY